VGNWNRVSGSLNEVSVVDSWVSSHEFFDIVESFVIVFELSKSEEVLPRVGFLGIELIKSVWGHSNYINLNLLVIEA